MLDAFDGYERAMARQERRQEGGPVPRAPKVQPVLAIMATPARRDGFARCDGDHTSARSSLAYYILLACVLSSYTPKKITYMCVYHQCTQRGSHVVTLSVLREPGLDTVLQIVGTSRGGGGDMPCVVQP